MKETKSIKLYNVVFPMFMIVLYPWLMVPFGIANFIIDSIIILLCYKLMKINDVKSMYKKTILKVWLLGFTADFLGAGFLWTASKLATNISEELEFSLNYNPYKDPYALLITVGTVLLCGLLIFAFNRWISLRKVALSTKQKTIISLAMAICTAPYLFLIPAY